MGVNVNGLRFLLRAKSAGVDFARTAMIGRQGLHLSFDQFCNVFRAEFNYDIDNETLEALYGEKYSDELLRYLGASVVHSFDYSDYEGSTHKHDFNQPIPGEYLAQYTAIIEGGSLEHIFNFPIAIKNCMGMIEVGGHYLGISPTNNYMGHGFYQFSPELYFRIFSQENGFRIKHIILHEGKETKNWYEVSDPKDVARRVGITNSTPTLLLILAEKLEKFTIFSTPPMQSDYVSAWKGINPEVKVNLAGSSHSISKRWIPSLLKGWIPRSVKLRIWSVLGWRHVGPSFSPLDPLESQAASSKLLQRTVHERRR